MKQVLASQVSAKALLPVTYKVNAHLSGVEYASYNMGVFLCPTCAGLHRGLGVHLSKVKHLKLDHWEDSQIRRLEEVGNINANRKYEERVPACYRRPGEGDSR